MKKNHKIDLGKSLTTTNFEKILSKEFVKSFNYERVIFDLGRIEWIALPELLLLTKWLNDISNNNSQVEILFPAPYFLDGIDESKKEINEETPILKPMNRRKRVLSFLERLGFYKEIIRITNNTADIFGSKENSDETIKEFSNINDPFEATILPISSFSDRNDLDYQKELSNIELKTLLTEYSVLDYVDSGVLSDVLIEELITNAINYGEKVGPNKNSLCTWISSRLVKSASTALKEYPQWLRSTYKSLIGKHFLEIVLCDSGIGVYEQLKNFAHHTIKANLTSVKSILDYAFDKYSSSSNRLRTEQAQLPRGLFWVYDIVRQYGGVLTIRSNGFYMGYDFLNSRKDPKLLNLWDSGGKCQNVNGTLIQILLPEVTVKPLNINTTFSNLNKYEPITIVIEPPSSQKPIIDFVKKIANEIEILCHGANEIICFVDCTALDVTNENHRRIFIYLTRYILYFQNPQLFWIIGPSKFDTLTELNNLITSKDKTISDNNSKIFNIFYENIKDYDKRVIPISFPDGSIDWLGTTKNEKKVLNYLWGALSITYNEIDVEEEIVIRLAKTNPNLLQLKGTVHPESQWILTFQFDIIFILNSIRNSISNSASSIIHHTSGVINRYDCYHLPHGSYSNYYIYLKPIFVKPNTIRQLARYLIYILVESQKKIGMRVDTILGGTHSAKRLIHMIAEELSAEALTIDRYIDQINEPSIEPIVANKKLIVVTDVISTGSFVTKIVEKLKQYSAEIVAICSICDLRKSSVGVISGIKIVSLFKKSVDKIDQPNGKKVYEINPISLRPTLLEEERKRNEVGNLIESDEFIDLVNNSKALVPAHCILGPTHYAYFIDTYELLKAHSHTLFKILLDDIKKQLVFFNLDPKSSLKILVTAEGSNAELFFPDLIIKEYPHLTWIKVDRIRLSKEGAWQLDRLDPTIDPVDLIDDSVVLVWDDGSNTGSTMMQLLEIISEYNPRVILAYCLINRLPNNKSLFFKKIRSLGHPKNSKPGQMYLKFVATLPIGTYVHSNCPICNYEKIEIPPIREIEQYWKEIKNRNFPYRWNHLSSGEIKDRANGYLKKLNVGDVDEFKKKLFTIRYSLGNFENTIGTTKNERKELLSFFYDYNSIIALCFIFNWEPYLLDSVVNFQMPKFKDLMMENIIYILKKDGGNIRHSQKIFIEFIAKTDANIIIENLALFIKYIFISKEYCNVFFSLILYPNDYTKSQNILNKFLTVMEYVPQSNIKIYMRGLCNSCLSWLRIKQLEKKNDSLFSSILTLKAFYKELGRPHEASQDSSAPLNRIINMLEIFRKHKRSPSNEYFDSIYRDWRDYTVSAISDIVPLIKGAKSIFSIELPTHLKRYLLYDNSELIRDYLLLQKTLLQIRESEYKDRILEHEAENILRVSKRMYNWLFLPTSSQIAKALKKIPVYIIKHLNQRIASHQWIKGNKISCKIYNPLETEVHGFMSSRVFKKIIDGVLQNIMKHNFKIGTTNFIKNKKNEIIINIGFKNENIIIMIKSNGPYSYNKAPSHGIRNIEEKCNAFHGSFRIYNENTWVKNEIILKRF